MSDAASFPLLQCKDAFYIKIKYKSKGQIFMEKWCLVNALCQTV